MTDMPPQLQHALSHVGVSWDAQRVEASWRGLRQKRRRRRAVRATVTAAAATAVILGGHVWSERGTSTQLATAPAEPGDPSPPPTAPEERDVAEVAPAPDDRLTLGRDVVVTPEEHARVDVLRNSGDDVAVRVVRGESFFQVPETTGEPVEVSAGDVQIRVFSSSFSVAHHDGETEVRVERGQVQIEWHEQKLTLDQGDRRRFAATEPGAHTRAPGRERRPRAPRADWRRLARAGHIDDAYDALSGSAQRNAVRDRPGDLMLAADVYRMSGHPRAAVAPLERMIRRFSGDPRAPLAAFTLGRVLLDELEEPARAARAFRKARDLAPGGALAEDALAREVEAWAKAGQTQRARERARLYMEIYPSGHRWRAVKQYGL